MSNVAIKFYPDGPEIEAEIPPEPTPEELSVEAIEFIRQGNLPPVLPLGLVDYQYAAPNNVRALQDILEKAWQGPSANDASDIEGLCDASERPVDPSDNALKSETEQHARHPRDGAPSDAHVRASAARDGRGVAPQGFYSSRHDVSSNLALLARAAMVVVVMIMVVAFARTATVAEDKITDPGRNDPGAWLTVRL